MESNENISINVLVFDDNPNDFELLQYHLRQMDGIRLQYCSNFKAFQQNLKEESFSIIICDYGLGSMTGVEVFEYVQEQGMTIPCIIFSGRR